jgi:hypothetical protein
MAGADGAEELHPVEPLLHDTLPQRPLEKCHTPLLRGWGPLCQLFCFTGRMPVNTGNVTSIGFLT